MYSIRDLGRREILMMSAVLARAGVAFSPELAAAAATLQRTPDQILGPFYPAYAWSSPIEGSTKRRFFAVLHQPPVDSPQVAVRAAIIAERKAAKLERE